MKKVGNETEKEYYYNIGFNLFGSLLYEFCKWIKGNLKSDTQVLFVAREGQFIKNCFDLMYPNEETKMIFLSRKSVLSGVAGEILKTKTFSELINSISLKRNETVKDFFYRIGLDINKYKDNLLKMNIKQDNLVDKNLDTFYKEYKKYIIEDLKNNGSLFSTYLENILDKKNLIVDIGWKGSMQNLLTVYLKSINSSKEIEGLYLGIMDNKNKKGYLFNENDFICQSILNYSGILEIIMMPNYGSVIGYKKNNDKIEPIFDKSEFTEDSLKIVEDIQEGILTFIKEQTVSDTSIRIEKETIIKELNRFAGNPKMEDIRKLEKLEFFENGQVYHLVEKVELNKLKTNFLNTKWKTAFLKKLFRIKLPYNRIVIFLRRKKDGL